MWRYTPLRCHTRRSRHAGHRISFSRYIGRIQRGRQQILLARVCEMMRDAGREICNVDITICAQRPKLSGYIGEMSETLAEVLGVDSGRVSVKATTTEHPVSQDVAREFRLWPWPFSGSRISPEKRRALCRWCCIMFLCSGWSLLRCSEVSE